MVVGLVYGMYDASIKHLFQYCPNKNVNRIGAKFTVPSCDDNIWLLLRVTVYLFKHNS